MALQVTQKILAPANETAGRVLACLPVPICATFPWPHPPPALFWSRPSACPFQGCTKTLPSSGPHFPTLGYFRVLSSESFPESPCSIRLSSCPPLASCSCHVSYFFYQWFTEHLSFSLDYQLLDGRPRICLFTVCPQCPARKRSSVNVWIEGTT